MKENLAQYELTFILGEKETPETTKEQTAAITALIEKLGGKVTKEESWGRRELAYEIKRNRSGYYVTLWMDFPKNQLIPMERELRFNERVIRFLTTKAYTTAQPGTLYPVAENAEGENGKEKESAEGEAQRRRASAKPAAAETAKKEEAADALPEEERKEKVDQVLEELLKDEA